MIAVTPEYKQAVYAPIRKTAAMVGFEIFDNEAYTDNTPSATSEAPISRKNQLTNKVRTMSHKYATFEQDYFKLDGSFYLPPRPAEGASELGWWSDELADAAGVFAIPQVVTFNFVEAHNSMGLSITFDTLNNEYAKAFDIDVYRLDGTTLVAHFTETNNTKPFYVWVQGLDLYGKIVITIREWGRGYRRARVTEVDFGIRMEYDGEKLIKANIVEQMNVVGDTIPANEIKFTIDNSSREFNILNPVGFYRFLKERQEVNMSIGVEVAPDVFQYIYLNKYYLIDWQSNEGALTSTFTARNIFELLEQKEYTVSVGANLYALAVNVLLVAGVIDYEIDVALQAISTTGFTEKIKCRAALQCIGIAGKCAVYQDRTGKLLIKRFTILDDRTSYITYAGQDMYSGLMYYPQTYSGFDMKNIDFDNVYKEPQIKLDQLLKKLVIKAKVAGVEQEFAYLNPGIKEGVTLGLTNPLIQSAALSDDVANWIIEESNLRALYQVNWRQNPCLEPGDIVIIEDSFGAKKQSRITKQEFEYAGYLSGKTETKGGV